MLSMEKRENFIRQYQKYFERRMKFMLAKKVIKVRYPRLVLALDGESFYNSKDRVVHLGIGDLNVDTIDDLLCHTEFLLGHEVQHILSTTNKAWLHGLNNGTKAILEEIAVLLKKPMRFRKESDYDTFLDMLKADGYNLSMDRIKQFAHFILNALEDGRIERIAMKNRPGFRNYVQLVRGQAYEETPVDEDMLQSLDTDYVYLVMMLNQILSLSTCQLYQKNFVDVAKADIELFNKVEALRPELKAAHFSGTCKGCAENSIKICRKLAEFIMKASLLDDFEQMMQDLMQQMSQSSSDFSEQNNYSASDKQEETDTNEPGESGGLFDSSDLDSEDSTGMNGNSNTGSSSSDEIDKSDNSTSSDASNDASDDTSDGNSSDSQSGSSNSEPLDKDEMSKKIKDALEKARENVSQDTAIAKKAGGTFSKNKPPKDLIEKTEDSTSSPPNIEGIGAYEEVTFSETERHYPCDEELPSELVSMASILKRKTEKLFRNQQKPNIREQKSGSIDPLGLHRLAMDQIDVFEKKAIEDEFDGCLYILQDNSGSMHGIKREECSRAVAVIEKAFENIMPMKIVAFDASGENVQHEIISNWNEKIFNTGAYNFLTHGYSGSGNMDGYDIRIATGELLRRPEDKKILFVLSDGYPVNYDGGLSEGINDVKTAVHEARNAGVMVVPIFFYENDWELEENEEIFKEMYETGYIMTEPSNIFKELEKSLKRFCFD